jgi:hypothetical protein
MATELVGGAATPGWSDDVAVALAPAATYARLLDDDAPSRWTPVVARAAFASLLVGTAVAIMATGRVTIPLVLTGALFWMFVPMLQLLMGAVLAWSAPFRAVAMPRALELWMLAHAPWSLWLLAVAAIVSLGSAPFLGSELVILSGLVPVVWTSIIVRAYCVAVLRLGRPAARWRIFAHQLMVWSAIVIFGLLTGGVWPRIVALIGE